MADTAVPYVLAGLRGGDRLQAIGLPPSDTDAFTAAPPLLLGLRGGDGLLAMGLVPTDTDTSGSRTRPSGRQERLLFLVAM